MIVKETTSVLNYSASPNLYVDILFYICKLNLKFKHCYVQIYLW